MFNELEALVIKALSKEPTQECQSDNSNNLCDLPDQFIIKNEIKRGE